MAALKDIALDKNGDLYIGKTGDFTIINSIRQALQIKLRWLKGEWVYNTSYGTPYFEDILVKNPDRAIIEKAIRDQILSVDGIIGINSISLSWDHATRVMNCKFSVKTTEGDIESEVTLING
jgi:hypothetical protein